MRKINYYRMLLGGISLLGLANVVQAQCVTPPTCAQLGYTKTASECSGHTFLKCPFDMSVGYCDLANSGPTVSCADGGYSDIKISGLDCTPKSYSGLTCYDCQTAKTCADVGYSSTQISGQNCTKKSYAGLTCYECKEKSCSELGYNLSSPKGQGWSCASCPSDPRYYSCTAIPCPSYSVEYDCLIAEWDDETIVGYSGDECCIVF